MVGRFCFNVMNVGMEHKKMNTALEYSTRVVQEGGRRCKKSTLNDLVHPPDPSKNTFNEPATCQGQDAIPSLNMSPEIQRVY